MQNELVSKSNRASYWLYIFIFIHLTLWTLVPILVRYNLPLDSIEGVLWGHQLELGYDKNPFLNGWLSAFAIQLGGQSGWMLYLFSQLSVVICFWAIWQLANRMLPPLYALLSVMILEGIQYYHFHAIDFNDNTLELSLWALTIFYFYQALTLPSKKAWLFTGLFAGLGMMAKYYTAALLAAMFFFLLSRAENRKQLVTALPYFGLALFLFIIMPHVIWLFFHDFITVQYVLERTSSLPLWSNHLFYPAKFTLEQFEVFIPALILFVILRPFSHSSSNATDTRLTVTAFDRSFLWYVGFGPFLLTLLLSLFFGIKLRAGWGMPLLSTWGILLIMLARPVLTPARIRQFIIAVFALMGLSLVSYSLSLVYSKTSTSANFPGQVIAQQLTQEWHDKFHTPLAYVAGSRWLGGNIGLYSKDHPAVYTEWDRKRSPWITEENLREKGAIFLWDMSNNETLPRDIRKRYPQLETTTIISFPWHREKYSNLPAMQIGVTFLPPANSQASS